MKTVSITIAIVLDKQNKIGAYGVTLRFGDHTKLLGDRQFNAAALPLALAGAIMGLQALKEKVDLTLVVDNDLFLKRIGELDTMRTNHWLKPSGRPILNQLEWRTFDHLFLHYQPEIRKHKKTDLDYQDARTKASDYSPR